MVCVLIVLLVSQLGDTIPVQNVPAKKYVKQVVVNGAIGAVLGAGAGVFYTMGNRAYENYRTDTTITQASADWSKVELYDNIRNVCAAGAAIFILRAVYYQLKQLKASKSVGIVPRLNYQCMEKRISIGISGEF